MAIQVAPLVVSLFQLALDRKKSKEEKKEAVKQAATEVVSGVIEGKKTTAVAVAGGVGALAFDVAQYLPVEYVQYGDVINYGLAFAGALLLLWKNKKEEEKKES